MANEIYEKQLTLLASEARTASENSLSFHGLAWARHWVIELNVTVAASEADDTLDVYIDFSMDGSTWYNAVHFTQVLGNGGAKREIAVLDTGDPGTSVFDAAADQASGAQLPQAVGAVVRARTVVVVGAGTYTFTYSVKAIAQ